MTKGLPPDAGRSGASLAPTELERALREATASMQAHGFGPRTALISDLRRAIGRQVSREEFDKGLCRLRGEGVIALVPHAHPECLGPFEVQDGLAEGQSLLYLLHWRK